MKKTEEKVTSADRKPGTSPDPTIRKPQQPRRENAEEIPTTPEYGAKKKVQPENWQSGKPSTHQDHQPNEDVDDIEEEESTV